jgi:purine-cytosine permease-like protein
MEQLYFLSIILNALAGLLLVFGDTVEGDPTTKGIRLFISSGGVRLVLGILAAITGFLKFLSPFNNTTPILGDMLPALAGICAGFILIFGFYRENTAKHDDGGNLDRIGDTLLLYKKAAGVFLLAVAVLHFLFPRALFL